MTVLGRALFISIAAVCSFESAAQAQFSAFEALFERITDVSIYVGSNRSSDDIDTGNLQISQFGIELIYNIGSQTTVIPGAAADSVEFTWTGMEVTRNAQGADTTNTYSVVYVAPPAEPRLSFELGLGYGQTSGIQMETDEFNIIGAVRDFPSASIYVSHVPTSLYAGVRSGLIQTEGLQAYSEAGVTQRGSATAFQVGGVIGFFREVGFVFPFVEAGWVFRRFGSIDWEGDMVPAELPRQLDISGWQVSLGAQVSLAE